MLISFPFYVFICAFVVLLLSYSTTKSAHSAVKINPSLYHVLVLMMAAFYAVVIMSRDLNHPGDTQTYIGLFKEISQFQDYSYLSVYRLEAGFLLLLDFISNFTSSGRVLLITLSTILTLLWVFSFRVWQADLKFTLCIFVFISLFSSYNFGANIIRQGMAIPIALLGLYYLLNRKILTCCLVFVFAAMFHKSALVFLVFGLVAIWIKNVRFLLIGYFSVSFLSFFDVLKLELLSQIITTYTSYSHIASNYALERYQTGFRLSFWGFSTLPVLLYFLTDKQRLSNAEVNLFKVYLLLITLFVGLFAVPFSDRVGILGWAMYPLLISAFIGKFRFSFINSYLLVSLCISIFGALSFYFYPVFKIGYSFKDIL